MIQVSIANILDSINVFDELSKKNMPGLMAFQIACYIKEIKKQYDLFQHQRTQLIQKYAQTDESGKIAQDEKGNILLRPNQVENFNADLQAILDTIISMPVEYLKLDDLKEISITPHDMVALLPFIQEKAPLE